MDGWKDLIVFVGLLTALFLLWLRLYSLNFTGDSARPLESIMDSLTKLAKIRLLVDAVVCGSISILIATMVLFLTQENPESVNHRVNLAANFREVICSITMVIIVVLISTFPSVSLSKRNSWFALAPLFRGKWSGNIKPRQMHVCSLLAWCTDHEFLKKVAIIYSGLTGQEQNNGAKLWSGALIPLVNRDALRRESEDLTQAVHSRFMEHLNRTFQNTTQNEEVLNKDRCRTAFGVSMSYTFLSIVLFAMACVCNLIIIQPWRLIVGAISSIL